MPAVIACPKCSADIVDSFGQVHSTLEWFTCRVCHYVWCDVPSVRRCAHCNSIRVSVSRFAQSTRLTVRCDDCGHTSDVEM